MIHILYFCSKRMQMCATELDENTNLLLFFWLDGLLVYAGRPFFIT
ncbi:MAG: hypothetical protein RSD75_02835 [Mucinivorans sp.]